MCEHGEVMRHRRRGGGGGGPVTVTDRVGGESGRRGGREGACSRPMRAGVKKAKASGASKVDDGGRLC